MPRLEVEDVGWLQLPKQPAGDGAPDDLHITAELGDLCDNRPKAVSQLAEWVQFWVTDHADPELLKENVHAICARLQFFNTVIPAPLEHFCILEEGIGLLRHTKVTIGI